MHVSGLVRYPVKSLRGHALDAAVVEARGLAGDRRWMVVDARDRFVTRREEPAMARIDVRVADDGLVLLHADLGTCPVAVPGPDAPLIAAVVWRDTVALRLADAAAGAWLSAALGKPVRLAYQPDDSLRPVDPRYATQGEHVSLADGYPVLVTTEASLAALNARLDVVVPMARFRPNVVVAGAQAWAEEGWERIRVGEVVLRLTRLCTRCVIVTQQPHSGERLEGNEPLATLRLLGRTSEHGVLFGQNAVAERLGTIRIGDQVDLA